MQGRHEFARDELLHHKNQCIALYHLCDCYVKVLHENPRDDRIVKNLETIRISFNNFFQNLNLIEHIEELELFYGEILCTPAPIFLQKTTLFSSFLKSIMNQIYFFTQIEGDNSPQ